MSASTPGNPMTPVPGVTIDDPPAPGPVSGRERIALIDVVRGFALFGVLLSNLIWHASGVATTEAQLAALPTARLDWIVGQAVQFTIDWKFYTLFSFLFGLGFAVQLTRARQRGAVGVPPVYLRRLGVLLGIGLAHAILLWYGDVLIVYALLGFA